MIAFRTIAILGVLAMGVAILLGLLSGGFADEGSEIWALTWGKVTLVDLYLGLVFFGAWVAFRERRPVKVALWWASLAVLGNLAAAVYLAIASFNSSTAHELLTGSPDPTLHQRMEQ